MYNCVNIENIHRKLNISFYILLLLDVGKSKKEKDDRTKKDKKVSTKEVCSGELRNGKNILVMIW